MTDIILVVHTNAGPNLSLNKVSTCLWYQAVPSGTMLMVLMVPSGTMLMVLMVPSGYGVQQKYRKSGDYSQHRVCLSKCRD